MSTPSNTPSASPSLQGPSTVYNKVELKNANKSLWLVKVPKYIHEAWQKAATSSDKTLGKIKQVAADSSTKGSSGRITYELADHLKTSSGATANNRAVADLNQVDEFKLTMTKVQGQHFQVLSAEDLPDQVRVDGQAVKQRVVVEGQVTARAELKPPEPTKAYFNMKSQQIRKSTYPRAMTKLVSTNPVSYKPVAIHHEQLALTRARKAQGRTERADRDQVMDLLFAAFEKHQYYTIKQLLSVTQQPVAYLKEILRDICIYNSKMPHKNMYELKPEYRHYNNEGREAEAAQVSSAGSDG